MVHTPFDIRERDIDVVMVGTRTARFTHSTQILDRLVKCFQGLVSIDLKMVSSQQAVVPCLLDLVAAEHDCGGGY